LRSPQLHLRGWPAHVVRHRRNREGIRRDADNVDVAILGIVQSAADLRQRRLRRSEARFGLADVGNVAAAGLRPQIDVTECVLVCQRVLLGVDQTIALTHHLEVNLDSIESDELSSFADAIRCRTHARFLLATSFDAK
jgi:hypothetical protein